MLRGAQDTWDGSRTWGRGQEGHARDISSSKTSLGKLYVLPSFPFFHSGTQMPPQMDPHDQS